MLHYVLHAGSVPWQDQLLYAALFIAAVVLIFLGFWWRKRALRPKRGDFAAMVAQNNIAQAAAGQEPSAVADAVEAFEQTRDTMNTVKSGIERTLSLLWAFLAGLLCLISTLAVVFGLRGFPHIDWGVEGFFAVVMVVCAWFTRASWRDFRGQH
ncbi:hypothetical protein KIK84_12140 [Curvibacter sp. CHRR-16]|uniref:hypothetical protein n=1 Tax=Curvibacter sp. CHRR-16 TaxID=2835872 RepID=UPI001BDB5979|nr:hypothetical protein [Curvibacter sp. CHRR-16]MBT0571080.1 hypothetical protein [Curvibacter sp. CHRR-16]